MAVNVTTPSGRISGGLLLRRSQTHRRISLSSLKTQRMMIQHNQKCPAARYNLLKYNNSLRTTVEDGLGVTVRFNTVSVIHCHLLEIGSRRRLD